MYRQTASDLARVREDVTSNQLAFYLNQLLGRAHNLIYMGHKPKISGLVRFYAQTFPRVFRETFRQTLLALLIFVVTGIATWAVTIHDPTFAHRMLGPQMMDTIERKEMWTQSIVTIKPLAASGILTNNLAVSFTTFAMGITAGIGTIWMMVTNGMLIIPGSDGNVHFVDTMTGEEIAKLHVGASLFVQPTLGLTSDGQLRMVTIFGGGRWTAAGSLGPV